MFEDVRGKILPTSKAYCANFSESCDGKKLDLNRFSGVARRDLHSNGWLEYNGKLFCPQCVKKMKKGS